MMGKYWPLWLACVALGVAVLAIIAKMGEPPATIQQKVNSTEAHPAVDDRPVLRIGLIPERNIFAQRDRYRALGDYLESQLPCKVELVTASSYQAVLADFEEEKIDAAFLGSLVAVMSFERHGTQVIAKPEVEDGVSTYRGVIFVRDDSPIQTVEDLANRPVAMVKTTTAGDLFPIFMFHEHDMWDNAKRPHVVWVGTHDDVVIQVMQGNVYAGAAKDLRIDAMEKAHQGVKVRRLATSKAVPNNAMVLRKKVAEELGERLSEILMTMHESEQGRAALKLFGAVRFLPCEKQEYAAVYEMSRSLGYHWGDSRDNQPASGTPAEDE